MKLANPLTEHQNYLVKTNMPLVHQVIKARIMVNEQVNGLGYEDLLQEGCLLLCKAAVTYEESRSHFAVYARKVIYNGLISYCRKVKLYESRMTELKVNENGELLYEGTHISDRLSVYDQITEADVIGLLASYAKQYSGITRKGIEALSQRIQGISVTQIAQAYHVPPSHVGAWISRALQKLRKNQSFLEELT